MEQLRRRKRRSPTSRMLVGRLSGWRSDKKVAADTPGGREVGGHRSVGVYTTFANSANIAIDAAGATKA